MNVIKRLYLLILLGLTLGGGAQLTAMNKKAAPQDRVRGHQASLNLSDPQVFLGALVALQEKVDALAATFDPLFKSLNVNTFMKTQCEALTAWAAAQKNQSDDIKALRAALTAVTVPQPVAPELQAALDNPEAIFPESKEALGEVTTLVAGIKDLQAQIVSVITELKKCDQLKKFNKLPEPIQNDLRSKIENVRAHQAWNMFGITNIPGTFSDFLDSKIIVKDAGAKLEKPTPQGGSAASLDYVVRNSIIQALNAQQARERKKLENLNNAPIPVAQKQVQEKQIKTTIQFIDALTVQLQAPERMRDLHAAFTRVIADEALKTSLEKVCKVLVVKQSLEAIVENNHTKCMRVLVDAAKPEIEKLTAKVEAELPAIEACKTPLLEQLDKFTGEDQVELLDALLRVIKQELSDEERLEKTAHDHIVEFITGMCATPAKFRDALKHFEAYYHEMQRKDKEPLLKTIHFMSACYDVFYNLYQADVTNPNIKPAGQCFMLGTGVSWAVSMVRLTARYTEEVKGLCEGKIAPFIEQERGLGAFVQAFSETTAPAVEFAVGVPCINPFGMEHIPAMQFNGLLRALYWRTKTQALDTGIGQKIDRILPAFAGGLFDQFTDQAQRMLFSALYYNLIRKNFFDGATNPHSLIPADFLPWKQAVNGTVQIATQLASGHVKRLIQASLCDETIHNVDCWTLGIVNPGLVDVALKLGKDLLLTHEGVTPWLNQLAKFDTAEIFGPWVVSVRNERRVKGLPELSMPELRRIYVERTGLTYVAGCLATYAGDVVTTHIVAPITKKVLGVAAGLVVRNEILTAAPYACEIALRIFLGGHSAVTQEEVVGLIEKCAAIDEKWQNMAPGVMGSALAMRSQFVAFLGIPEQHAQSPEVTSLIIEKFCEFLVDPQRVIPQGATPVGMLDVVRHLLLNPRQRAALVAQYKLDGNIRSFTQALMMHIPNNIIAHFAGWLCGWKAQDAFVAWFDAYVAEQGITPLQSTDQLTALRACAPAACSIM
jgi:hypothetical protein